MVRHADPVKRDGCVDLTDYSSGSTMYRPERHDLVVYDSENGELRIHADNKLEPELFRTAFGEHIFGNRDFFPLGIAKYTLEPLKTLGRELFDAPGVEGVVRAWFREVEFERFGKLREREIHKSDDLFTAFAARGFVIPEDPSIHVRRAKFAVQFTDSKRPRMVTVRPSNYAQFGRDDDAIIVGKLLDRLGLISKDEPADAEQDGSVENH